MNTILMSLIIMTMTYEMPKLPYANNALEPVISQQTIDSITETSANICK